MTKGMKSKVRELLADGGGQLVPHGRVQAGEQLLNQLAGYGAAHLYEVHIMIIITRAEEMLNPL